MSAASSLVMIVTESFRTPGSLAEGIWGEGRAAIAAETQPRRREGTKKAVFVVAFCYRLLSANDRVGAGLQRARSCRRQSAATAAERHELYRLEIDDRLVVVRDCLNLRGAGEREIALRLEHEEALRHAGGELLLLGLEFPFLELARRFGRQHALLVGLNLAREFADLGGDLHLEILQLRLRLLILQPRARQVRLRGVGAERVGNLHADGPVWIRALEHIAQDGPEA